VIEVEAPDMACQGGKPPFSCERNGIFSSKPVGVKALARPMSDSDSMVRARQPGKLTAGLISTGPSQIYRGEFLKKKKKLAS